MVLMMASQAEGVHGYVRRLMPAERYLRVDPQLPKELSGLDDTENIPSLLARAGEAARESLSAAQAIL
jgi:hypothetical protein